MKKVQYILVCLFLIVLPNLSFSQASYQFQSTSSRTYQVPSRSSSAYMSSGSRYASISTRGYGSTTYGEMPVYAAAQRKSSARRVERDDDQTDTTNPLEPGTPIGGPECLLLFIGVAAGVIFLMRKKAFCAKFAYIIKIM